MHSNASRYNLTRASSCSNPCYNYQCYYATFLPNLHVTWAVVQVKIHTKIDSRCQSFAARRGSVVHFADLWLREALLTARRGPVVHRATNTKIILWIISKIQ